MISAQGEGLNEGFRQQVVQCLTQACLNKGHTQQEAEEKVASCDWQDVGADQVKAFLRVLAVAWSTVRAQAGL
jgi:hypothetical protein